MIKKYVTILGFTLSIGAQSALATHGFQQHCIGAVKCSTAGAGAATASNAIDALINPALLAKQDNHWIGGVGIARASVSMNTEAAYPIGNRAAGTQSSSIRLFPEYSLGALYKLNEDTTLAFSIASLGGFAAKYSSSRTNPALQASGTFDNRLRYRVVHAAPAISWRVADNVTLGGAVLVGYSDLKTNSAQPSTTPPLRQTSGNNRLQRAYGIGVRLGVTWGVNHLVDLGFSVSTPTKFKKFSKYNDILLSSVDTPMNMVLGSTWHVSKDTDVLFDVKEILFKQVKILGKTPANGGFGWNNQTVFMAGLTHRFEKWTASLGYNYATALIKKNRTFANILLPGIVQNHFSLGLGYKMTKEHEIYMTGFYVPQKKQTDSGNGDVYSRFGKGSWIKAYGYGVQIGLKSMF